jgi:hypothetical protein
MSDTNENIEQTNTGDTGASDHSSDRFDHGDGERHESVRSAIKDAFRQHGADVPDDKDEDQRQMERRAEPKGRAARAAKEATSADTKSRDPASADPKAGSTDNAAGTAAIGQIDIRGEAPLRRLAVGHQERRTPQRARGAARCR